MNAPLEILIVDDEAAFRKILEKRLLSLFAEAKVTQLDSIASARELLRSQGVQRFDLVILDQHLGDGRGTDFLKEGLFEDLAVIVMSSDTAPGMAGEAVQAGASYFLNKTMVSEALFPPLVLGVLDRNRIQKSLQETKLQLATMETIRVLVSTLRHEINNPLGAVLGAAYLLQSATLDETERKKIADLVESSGKRIKHVLDEICKAMSLEPVTKANQKVFQIPGDKPWETK